MMGTTLRLSGIYLVSGVFFTTIVYLATGIPQFGVDVLGPSFEETKRSTDFLTRDLRNIPTLAFVFLITRFVVAAVVAVALAACVRRRLSHPATLLVGVGLPVAIEILFARPYAHTWVGMLVASIVSSSSAVLPPASVIVRTTAAYIIPPALAGLVTSLWVIYMLKRKTA